MVIVQVVFIVRRSFNNSLAGKANEKKPARHTYNQIPRNDAKEGMHQFFLCSVLHTASGLLAEVEKKKVKIWDTSANGFQNPEERPDFSIVTPTATYADWVNLVSVIEIKSDISTQLNVSHSSKPFFTHLGSSWRML